MTKTAAVLFLMMQPSGLFFGQKNLIFFMLLLLSMGFEWFAGSGEHLRCQSSLFPTARHCSHTSTREFRDHQDR